VSKYLNMLSASIPNLEERNLGHPFEELGVDSFDLISIRVDFERHLGAEIPDAVWLNLKSFAELIAYVEKQNTADKLEVETGSLTKIGRSLELNMPQMAIESLSENWLFKELGASHWALLCRGLHSTSASLQDEVGNRLYATFARIQIVGTASLAEFEENEQVTLKGTLSRYGNGMYFGEFSLSATNNPAKRFDARLLTSFSRRGDTGNKNLVKSSPCVTQNSIENLATVPQFIDEYRLVKKNASLDFEVNGVKFTIDDNVLFETVYELNPYYDLNGAGLLYFAAYPVISDLCEARYGNSIFDKGRWEQSFFMASRDIMYYANCDISDAVIYRLNAIKEIESGFMITSSLYRKSDNMIMARVFTIKRQK
jgi:probable biosynthetic protein (TIGR04098 family)